MKILVIGSNGMAGHVITKYLRQQNFDVATAARADADFLIDIENTNECRSIFDKILSNYDFVINCIGLLVKDSLDRPDRAIILNTWFPHYLESASKNIQTKIIHLSTDCVFNGSKGNYIETDPHTETNYYGKSKSFGELDNSKDVTFRMSIIGPELKANGTGLLHWVTTNTNEELEGWANAWWNGITTLQLAKCIEKYINNPCFSGIYHLVNNDVSINKYDLLCKINSVYDLGKVIKKSKGPKDVNKILVDTRKLLDFEIPNYDQQLKEMKNFK